MLPFYESLEREATELLKDYQEKAKREGLLDVQVMIDFGNPRLPPGSRYSKTNRCRSDVARSNWSQCLRTSPDWFLF